MDRFRGKPLALLHGLPMIEHVFRWAKLCSQLDDVYGATCDEEIRDVAEAFGAEVIMTSAVHERATDRVAQAVEHFAADIVVMIQGDEPMITPEMIQSALEPFRSDPSTTCVNLVHRIRSQREFVDPNTIKVVADVNGNALYFSRSPIPARRFRSDEGKIFKQVCVIPFTRQCLQEFSRLPLVGIAWIARLSIERRAIEPLIALAPGLRWTELKFQSRISLRRALRLTLRNLRYIPRVYKIGRRMHLQHESFKAMLSGPSSIRCGRVDLSK